MGYVLFGIDYRIFGEMGILKKLRKKYKHDGPSVEYMEMNRIK